VFMPRPSRDGGRSLATTPSVDNLLDKNPNLRQRLGGVGDRINSPNVDVSKAEVSLTPGNGTVGTTVILSAKGLPADTAVVIGGGAPGTAYEVLQRARTTRREPFRPPCKFLTGEPVASASL
jgi:hypothetical protein